ncbi:hypothetical protein F2Q69_00019728 [Brassica cretica]|uniref:Uncharacterized protein n=1 Tax=Brassica cretica TaxID=69181 RepID=A0A8S9Q6B4_BRACR|nr:hypothetical protein F2Q69_00019728 [Brassica cretica]
MGRSATVQRGLILSAAQSMAMHRGHTTRVEPDRGFLFETSRSEGTDRGHEARLEGVRAWVEAIRGRYQNCLIHLSFGATPGDDTNTKRELKALQDKMDMLLLDRAKQEKVNFVGEQKQEGIAVLNEVDGLEGQEELCFVNVNGTWYKKEPNFQYNNYQQKPFYNNQQGGYQARQNYSQGFPSKGNQSTQGQAGSSTYATQESSTDAMLKQILESQTRSEKHVGYELKNLHTKLKYEPEFSLN